MPQGRGTTTTGNHQQTILLGVLFSRRATDGGWLDIKLSDGKRVSISEYTRVLFYGVRNGRMYYRIDDEGCEYNGWDASSVDSAFNQYWVAEAPDVGDYIVRIKYLSSSTERSVVRNQDLLHEWGNLTVDGRDIRVTLNTEPSRGYVRIPVGTHKIMRPDYSHANIPTTGYVDYVKTQLNGNCYGNDTWFPIEINGIVTSRYVHIGHLSDGCVTVYELEAWSYIYDYLIKRRQGNVRSKYIADLIVEQ